MYAGDVGAKGTDWGNRHRCKLTYTRRVTYYRTALSGETKVVMEYTGAYYEPIANALHNQGIFVSVVNPLLIDDYSACLIPTFQMLTHYSLRRESDGREKWVNFVLKFPHIHSISKLSLSAFKVKYQSLCRKNN